MSEWLQHEWQEPSVIDTFFLRKVRWVNEMRGRRAVQIAYAVLDP